MKDDMDVKIMADSELVAPEYVAVVEDSCK